MKRLLFILMLLITTCLLIACSGGDTTTAPAAITTAEAVTTSPTDITPTTSVTPVTTTANDPPPETATTAMTMTVTPATTAVTTVAPVTTQTPVTTEPTYQNTQWDGKTLKILAIGNSFSVDGMEYLYQIAKAEGVKQIILGNLYIGGCSLQTHYGNAKKNTPAYEYYKNTNGTWRKTNNTTMLDGILDEDWDIITMQQVSGYSGQAATYKLYLKPLADYVEVNKTDPDCQFAWHMTWAYQQNSTHGDFPKYNSDQMTMYKAITTAVKRQVLSLDAFNILIPSGTAIQNCRTGFFGDTLTRDGYHMSDLGRYIAGYTWFTALTGQTLDSLSYKPGFLSIDEATEALIVEAVNNAQKKPLEVTESSYTEKPTFDLTNYEKLDFDYTMGAYWNSGDGNTYNKLVTGADNSPYFIATELFNKDTLPVGAVIVIDEGWQYRPERWTGNTVQQNRPNPTTQEYVVVTEDFWEGYAFRAFNISNIGANLSIKDDPSAVEHFNIYIPKSTAIPDIEVSFTDTTDPDITEAPTTPDTPSEGKGPALPAEYDASQYEMLDFDYTVGAYWNSSDVNGHHNLWASNDNSKFFIATELFTKDTLPVGSIVVLDEGWQYRPERWRDEGQQSNRPGNSTDPVLLITEDWWKGYTHRAFNIAKVGANTDITGDPNAITHFAIYIPQT